MITMPCVCSAATPNVWVNRRSTGWCSPSLLFYLSKYISDNISDVCLTLHGRQTKLLRAKLHIFCRTLGKSLCGKCVTHMWPIFDWLTDVTRWMIMAQPNTSWPCASHITTWVREFTLTLSKHTVKLCRMLESDKETPRPPLTSCYSLWLRHHWHCLLLFWKNLTALF